MGIWCLRGLSYRDRKEPPLLLIKITIGVSIFYLGYVGNPRGLPEMPTTDELAVVPPHELYILTKGRSHRGRLYSWPRLTQQTKRESVVGVDGWFSARYWTVSGAVCKNLK